MKAWRPATEDELILRLVVVTPDDEFHARLQQIALSCHWRIARAASIEEAEVLIASRPTPLVVYEADRNDTNWRVALGRLNGQPTHPCVLLASRVADDNLLHEVLRNHGYDILPKPATREKLIHRLNLAWFWALAWGRGRP